MDTKNSVILIIEDNNDIRDSTEEILTLADYTVLVAENGKKGVELAQAHIPDLILCDIMMPELDGYGVMYMLNKNENTANIPFIFITAKAERTDFRRGMDMGADDYITKPFDGIELLNAIETRLAKRNKLQNSIEQLDKLNSIFDEANTAQLLADLSEKRKPRTLKKKQHIFLEGDQPLNVFLVKSGSVRTYMIANDGREIVTGMFKPGDFFGYEMVILNQSYTDNAETMETAEICLISREDFDALLFKNHGISKKFIQLLSGNVQARQDQLVKVAYNSVRKRVADALTELTEKFGVVQDNVLTIKVSRDDLAAMVGTAGETVSRTLADFKDERLIEKEGGTIKVLDLQKLRSVKQ